MFSYFFPLLLLVSYSTVYGKVLEFSFDEKHHPLVVAEQKGLAENTYGQTEAISADYSSKGIQFHLFEELEFKYRILLTCPAENAVDIDFNDRLMKKHSSVNILLFENKDEKNKNQYCEAPLVPSITAINADYKCGVGGIGKFFNVGYWVNLKNAGTKNYKEKPEFITIYEVCKNTKNNVETSPSVTSSIMFTKHTLHIGQLEKYETSQKELEEQQFYVAFEQNKKKLLPKMSDKNIHQFVPYNDMIPVPWKTSTLFDINTIYVNANVQVHLNKINDFLRNFSTTAIKSLTVFSGVKIVKSKTQEITENSNLLFWKIVERRKAGIAIMVYDQDQSTSTCNAPCENSEEICIESGLQILKNDIPCLFCCQVNTVVEYLGIISIDEKSVRKSLNLPELLKFKTASTERSTSLRIPSFKTLSFENKL